MRLLSCLFCFLLLCFASVPSRADTITNSFNFLFVNFSGTSFDSFGVPKFNPALGTLTSVTETLTGNIVVTGTGSYHFSTENGIVQDSSVSGMFSKQTILDPSSYIGTAGFPGYRLDVLDYSTTGTLSFSSIGQVVNTYTYNYTPAAVTPEPSSLLLLGTGLVGVCTRFRRRMRAV